MLRATQEWQGSTHTQGCRCLAVGVHKAKAVHMAMLALPQSRTLEFSTCVHHTLPGTAVNVLTRQ